MQNNYWRYSPNQLIDRICRLEVIEENDQRRLRELAAENVELRSECERLSQANRALKMSAGRAESIAPLPQPVAHPPALPAPVVSVAPGQYNEAMVAALNAYYARWRSAFRRDADHFSAVLGMVIGIVGIVLLSRLHEARWANWRQTGLHWKVEDPSCRKKGCPCARSKKSLDFNPWGCHSAR